MRRRLWWSIVFLEIKVAEHSGTRPSADVKGDTFLCSNINDADLDPDMTETPAESPGITDAVFIMVKTLAMKTFGMDKGFEPGDFDTKSFSERDAAIDRLQAEYEERILRFCDPLVPLHVFASILCSGVICKMRVAAHSPFRYSEQNIPMPQSAKDLVWQNGKKLIDYANLMHASPMLERFRWAIGPQFIWDSFIFILGELRHRKTGPDVEDAWSQIAQIFDNYPENSLDATNPNFLAVGLWTLRVWEATAEARFGGDGVAQQKSAHKEPIFIRRLRRFKQNPGSACHRDAIAWPLGRPQMPSSMQFVPADPSTPGTNRLSNSSEFDDLFDVPLDGFDWAKFDQIFQ